MKRRDLFASFWGPMLSGTFAKSSRPKRHTMTAPKPPARKRLFATVQPGISRRCAHGRISDRDPVSNRSANGLEQVSPVPADTARRGSFSGDAAHDAETK